jgi:hypothetical protein
MADPWDYYSYATDLVFSVGEDSIPTIDRPTTIYRFTVERRIKRFAY